MEQCMQRLRSVLCRKGAMIAIIVPIFFAAVNGFNLAPKFASVVHDPLLAGDNYFGYTVELLAVTGANPFRVFVGAPKSRSVVPTHGHLKNPGVLYQCTFISGDEELSCKQMTLQQTGEGYYNDPWRLMSYQERKEDSLLGLSLAVNLKSSEVVVCSPGWKNQFYAGYYLMNGACYAFSSHARPEDEAQKLLPLLNRSRQGFEATGSGKSDSFFYSYGEAGFSVHLPSREGEIILGAPGIFDWKGSVIRMRSSDYQDVLTPNTYFTPKIPSYPYFGYAVGSGHFSRGSELLYVASAPRALSYRGAVYIFDFPDDPQHPFDIRLQLSGRQMGEYFGATLCVADLNGDGLDDLLVGAPLHSKQSDEGRMYAFINEGGSSLVESEAEFMGSKVQGARFASAIALVGDLNLDGFPDVAVGAPYETHDASSGSVYIYFGGPSGLAERFAQRIAASEISSGISGFGISISRGVDVDFNGYKDIVVGAHESGHIVLIKSSPIILFSSRVEPQVSHVQNNTKEFDLKLCVKFSGQHAAPSLDANVTVSVDRVHQRAFLSNKLTTKSMVWRLSRDVEDCRSERVSLRPVSLWNPMTTYASLPLVLHYRVARDTSARFCKTCPVTEPSAKSVSSVSIPVLSSCNKNTVCLPAWKLSAEFPSTSLPYVVGSKDTVNLRIHVRNDRDSAHLRNLHVQLPGNVTLRVTPSVCEKSANSSDWDCFNGLLITTDSKKSVDFVLDMGSVTTINATSLVFNISAHSFDGEDEAITIELPIVRVTRLEVSARASPELHVRMKDEKKSFPVTHSYHVYISGFSPADAVKITFEFPFKFKMGDAPFKPILESYEMKGTLDLQPVSCSEETSGRGRREAEPAAVRVAGRESPLVLHCGRLDVECLVVTCSAGPLLVTSQGIQMDLKMSVLLDHLDLILEQSFHVNLNTSVTVGAEPGATVAVQRTVGTRFEGSEIPEREDPWFWGYIALAVVIAVLILALLVYLLFKCKFFERRRGGTEDEVDGAAGKEGGEDRQQETANLVE